MDNEPFKQSDEYTNKIRMFFRKIDEYVPPKNTDDQVIFDESRLEIHRWLHDSRLYDKYLKPLLTI